MFCIHNVSEVFEKGAKVGTLRFKEGSKKKKAVVEGDE